MWTLYNRLIENIPNDITVDHIHMGETWTILHAGPYCGISVTTNEQHKTLPSYDWLVGKDLHSVAELVKSWDLQEASVGAAAINAYYNSPLTALNVPGMQVTKNAFSDYSIDVQGKDVAIIGHFINLERFLTEAAHIDVLERKPEPGDLPDSACEYVLPDKDFVFITGAAFANKTLPRLLQLSKGKAIILGPSTPMSPILFDFGADELSGMLPDKLPYSKSEEIGPGNVKLSAYGQRVRLKKSNFQK